MLDVMIDLETMDSGPNAAIVAIGTVEFDTKTCELGERFYKVVNLASAVEAGGVLNPNTIMWWMRQSEEARAVFKDDGEPVTEVLAQFTAWLEQRGPLKDIRIWGNGASFDNVILASAYKRLGQAVPWVFWNDRCYRTIKSLNWRIKMQRSGTHHNALDDAESQARHLIEILSAGKDV